MEKRSRNTLIIIIIIIIIKYVGNDVYIWEMAQVFEKRLNYMGNDLDLWEMAQICGEMT